MIFITLTLPCHKVIIVSKHNIDVMCVVLSFPVQEIVDNPYVTKSDSFYFVEGKLMMHNKADYAYTDS